eukprot:Gregarina_sp_Poly_1__3830@NODE_2141_length_2614_cov_168_080879_g1379_i0_p4_GENE_NODE_2141_length_2614_cov_168_080879_g1379_i0NODE_2141_length_2614_cov_168_080879_g1379_i0_p4_ORF_typecomplete_len161_score32_98zfC2H2_jaz/PF12171_8/9_1e06zfU1/PF06220_12/1_4e04zfU1/PF06220_12/9_6e05zfmet/PF12874_7/0_0018CCDC84/PF14968_6/1_6e03CCDC84/PF14968_6/0_035zf_C2H2_ZHX/PF18387_1/2_8e02zf_C2H2_ZHX/PF18387_1/0_63_NODE_2141_length_2614_cov_168_080879_g1379_i021312571
MSEGNTKTDAFGRKIWDKAQYGTGKKEKSAEEDEKQIKQKRLADEATRTHLKERDFDLNLDKTLGEQKVIAATAPAAQQGGYWCSVCECLLKDSSSYLDHLNGKKHNRTLGMSMRVKKATKSDVAQRLKALKEKKELLKSTYGAAS